MGWFSKSNKPSKSDIMIATDQIDRFIAGLKSNGAFNYQICLEFLTKETNSMPEEVDLNLAAYYPAAFACCQVKEASFKKNIPNIDFVQSIIVEVMSKGTNAEYANHEPKTPLDGRHAGYVFDRSKEFSSQKGYPIGQLAMDLLVATDFENFLEDVNIPKKTTDLYEVLIVKTVKPTLDFAKQSIVIWYEFVDSFNYDKKYFYDLAKNKILENRK